MQPSKAVTVISAPQEVREVTQKKQTVANTQVRIHSADFMEPILRSSAAANSRASGVF